MSKKIGRVELLMWLNELLQLTYVQIEQAGSGAAYCQIIDSIFGDVPLSKVKFNAKHEHEYIINYKILQQAFDKHHVSKEIPIEKLIKKRFADNFEFLSWMKQYWEETFQGGNYNAHERRELCSRPGSRMQSPRMGNGVTSISNGPYGRTAALSPMTNHTQTRSKSRNFASPNHGGFGNSSLLQRTHVNLTELKKDTLRVTGERDFYYTKLREVESLYNELVNSELSPEAAVILDKLQKILFSEETATQRLLSPAPPSQEYHTNGIPDTLPNMLSAITLDDASYDDISHDEIDETETF